MNTDVRVADQVWIATALLQRESPERSFASAEIEARAHEEFGELSPGFRTHLAVHCVAGKKPNRGRYRILTKSTGRGMRRLFRRGDPVHEERGDGKQMPVRREIPSKYWTLLDWYEQEYNGEPNGKSSPPSSNGPDGSGKNWLRFVGYINAHDLAIMKRVIEEEFEQVHPE
jgi:hypothetical protein